MNSLLHINNPDRGTPTMKATKRSPAKSKSTAKSKAATKPKAAAKAGSGTGTRENPWTLKTANGGSEFIT
jgi:hypothetical protein